MCATTQRKVSVKAGSTNLEHNLRQTPEREREKKKSWTGPASRKLLEGVMGELLWALPGAGEG